MYDYGSGEVTVYDEVSRIKQISMVHLFGLCNQGNSKMFHGSSVDCAMSECGCPASSSGYLSVTM
jgi:hypothetical protein